MAIAEDRFGPFIDVDYMSAGRIRHSLNLPDQAGRGVIADHIFGVKNLGKHKLGGLRVRGRP